MPDPEASSSAPSVGTLPARIITYAWGEAYVDELLSLALPALLAPGNLPYLASQVECELILLTEERFFPKISAHPVIIRARTHCAVRLVGLDDLLTRSDQYGMALTYVLHRGFADLGAAMTDHWLVFLNADFILADGSLRSLLGQLASGERIVASPSYCTVKEDTLPELKARLAADPTVLAVSPRDMARMILQHRHNTVRGKTVNQDRFHLLQADQFYWQVDDATLIGHQMPVAIVGMRPERSVPEPNSYWDHGLMLEFCPAAEVKILGDSDDFLMLELRGRAVAQNDVVDGLPDPKELAERMIDWVTPYQASFAKRPLTLHASDIPANVEQERKHLADYVDEVMSHAPSHFPSHLNHPQWSYHWPAFMKARHALFATKLDAKIADSQLQSTYAVDNLWWRLTAIEKKHARKIALMTAAMREIDRELEAFPRILMEKLAASLPSTPTTTALYSSVTMAQVRGGDQYSGLGETSADLASILPAVEDAWVRKNQEAAQRKGILQEALAAAEWEFRSHEGIEYADLKRAYDGMIEPSVKSAGFPKIRWRVGNALPAPAGILRRVVGPVYRALFGRWPRVTMLSPFWAPFQPLLHAIDEAEGAQNILIVGDHSGIAQRIDDLPGVHVWISIEGLVSGLLGSVLPQRTLVFDLCVVDLKTDEVSQWEEIIRRAKPHTRPGGSIVGFHMNAGQPLTAAPPRIDEHTTLHFAGSADSVRAIAMYARWQRPARLRPVRWARVLAGLALGARPALRANRAEAAATRAGRHPPPDLRTSLTITVPLPWFEGDDGTLDYSTRAGVFVTGVEAPVTPEHRVDAAIANPPGTMVVLTFGQSNAANEGAGHYVPRHPVHVFNIFDMNFYKAADPLPGATNAGGSVWGRLGDKLIEAGRVQSVVFVPIAFGGSFIRDWTPIAGDCYRRLRFALSRIQRAGIGIDMLCWHQGEAEANHTMMPAEEYADRFRLLVKKIRRAGIVAPIYVAVSSICENGPHPHNNHEQIRRAQRQLVSPQEGLLPGPDTDQFDGDFRSDGCHLSEQGLDAVAQAWLKAIVKHPPPRLKDVRRKSS